MAKISNFPLHFLIFIQKIEIFCLLVLVIFCKNFNFCLFLVKLGQICSKIYIFLHIFAKILVKNCPPIFLIFSQKFDIFCLINLGKLNFCKNFNFSAYFCTNCGKNFKFSANFFSGIHFKTGDYVTNYGKR